MTFPSGPALNPGMGVYPGAGLGGAIGWATSGSPVTALAVRGEPTNSVVLAGSTTGPYVKGGG